MLPESEIDPGESAAEPPAADAPSSTQSARTVARGQDTRHGLLAAAERILIEEGVQALTVRRIGAVAGLNPALVSYHFVSVTGLLTELCRLNVEPMLAEWEPLRRGHAFGSAREVLRAWLVPLRRPAAFLPEGRSLVVLDEIASHGTRELRDQLLVVMLDVSGAVQSALRPFTPHLDARTLRARVRFLSSATLGPPPRARPSTSPSMEDSIESSDFLLDFAAAALMIKS